MKTVSVCITLIVPSVYFYIKNMHVYRNMYCSIRGLCNYNQTDQFSLTMAEDGLADTYQVIPITAGASKSCQVLKQPKDIYDTNNTYI